MITEYLFEKSPVDVDRLENEIRSSAIITALDHIDLLGSDLSIYMRESLSDDDENILSSVVSGHSGEAWPSNVVSTVNLVSPKDSDGSFIFKTKTTRTGWHYEPRSIDFISAKVGSKYNKKHNTGLIDTGTSYGDASLKFYDASMVEIVSGYAAASGFFPETPDDYQARVTANCTVTHLDWQPTYEMDIIGGMIQVLEPPPDRAYMWAIVAPDIPEVYGGSVPFLAGGFNLQYFKSGGMTEFNGRGVKTISPDFVYNTNKFRIVVKHSVGRQIGLQVYFEHFKA